MTSTVSEKRSATCRSRWSDVTGRALDWIFALDEGVITKAIGLVFAGSLILLWAGLRITPQRIGA